MTPLSDTMMMQIDDNEVTSDIEDIVAVMRHQESTIYRRRDYLATGQFQHVVDGSWRQRIVEWMFGVVDTCSLRRDSVAVAAYYIDVCVTQGVITSRQDFQLAAMTALQLAIKLYDSTVMKLNSMVKLGRGLFTEQDVIEMESKMLKAMKWLVHPPTPVCFLRQYLRLLPQDLSPVARFVIGEVTRFVSEISVCIYKFSQYPPSALAFAGVLIAMERIDEISLPHWQRQQILAILSRACQLEPACPQMIQIVTDLHLSLDRNVSIQDLMKTIDAQCQQGLLSRQQKQHLKKKTCGHRPSSVVGRSPRDVRSTRRL